MKGSKEKSSRTKLRRPESQFLNCAVVLKHRICTPIDRVIQSFLCFLEVFCREINAFQIILIENIGLSRIVYLFVRIFLFNKGF